MKMKWKITMMGTFRMGCEETELDINGIMGKQLASLLAYLIVKRDRIVTKQTLIETFWHDCKSPQNAMKFAIFRLRRELEQLPYGQNEEWILTVKGGYQFNPELDCDLDVAELEAICSRSDAGEADRLAALAQGAFLSGMEDEWIRLQREYLWRMMVESAETMSDELEQREAYRTAETLYKTLLMLEPYNDQVYYLYLRNLVRQRRFSEAIQMYDAVAGAFYREYGIEFQGKSQALIYFISAENGNPLTLDELISSLDEEVQEPMAFYCERPVFQKLYQVNCREIRRTRGCFYLLLLNLRPFHEEEDISDMLEYLNRVLKNSLRGSDIFCRVSQYQYAIMMEMRRKEDAYIIVDRVCSRFYKRYPSDQARLNYDVRQIGPLPLSARTEAEAALPADSDNNG